MAATYFPRTLEPTLRRAAREFPVVALTGPRQSGKTTLLRRVFGQRFGYVSLDLPDVQAAASSDPRGFLALHPPPVIFDEVQAAPELLFYIKEQVDSRRDRPGQYLLSGSQNLLLMSKVAESLAGRAAILRLFPLSRREIAGLPAAPLFWETPKRVPRPPLSFPEFWKSVLRGGYPELAAHPKRDAGLWQASYIQTYLERDVRNLRQVGDLTSFQSFLRLLAARNGQLLNLTELARDLGLAVNTAKAWLAVLEASFQVVILRPYFANVGKRLVKTPKVYFTDTGTLCYLSGLKDPEHAAAGPMAGAIMESAVLSELVKTEWHRGREPHLYFFRTTSGEEVDLVMESGARLVPLEIKLSATPKPAMAQGVKKFQLALGPKAAAGYVVHPGEARQSLAPGVTALPFSEL